MKGVPYTVGILRPGKPSLPRREDIARKVGLIGARQGPSLSNLPQPAPRLSAPSWTGQGS
jgi:hypothetical protein